MPITLTSSSARASTARGKPSSSRRLPISNVYNAFYDLPSLNGLGAPANPALGTFTQVAPDGLTPFIPGDSGMTNWAQEISLDVLWAHAIAPCTNITLVLAKSDADADILSATKYAVDHNLGDVISQSYGENESCMDPAGRATTP